MNHYCDDDCESLITFSHNHKEPPHYCSKYKQLLELEGTQAIICFACKIRGVTINSSFRYRP